MGALVLDFLFLLVLLIDELFDLLLNELVFVGAVLALFAVSLLLGAAFLPAGREVLGLVAPLEVLVFGLEAHDGEDDAAVVDEDLVANGELGVDVFVVDDEHALVTQDLLVGGDPDLLPTLHFDRVHIFEP